MIHTGITQELTAVRSSTAGMYLGDGDGNDVLLPNKYIPEGMRPGQPITVFVYRDSEDRQVATTLVPILELNEFAPLEVVAVTRLGAFANMGLEKDLLIPFAEQQVHLAQGEKPVVFLGLDRKTDRLYGSTRLGRHLDNRILTVEEGEAVDLLVHGQSELGWSAVVNNRHEGLLHHSEVHRRLEVGDRLRGYIVKVRGDGKLDLTLQAPGYTRYNDDNMARVVRYLREHDGVLPLTDKSPPEAIEQLLGMSKRAFKQAVGGLYKARKVKLGAGSVIWIGRK